MGAMSGHINGRVYHLIERYGPIGAAGIMGELGLDALALEGILRALLEAGLIVAAGRDPDGAPRYAVA